MKSRPLLSTLAVVAWSAMVLSCGGRVANEPLFFAVDSLVSSQVKHLARSAASLKKISSLDGDTSQSTYAPGDTVAWNKELEIFRQLDQINKPVNRGLYETRHSEGGGGKRSTVFTALDKDLTVEELRLDFAEGQLKSIAGRIKGENSMYESKRLLLMDFKNHHGLPVLSSYSLKGGQEMFIGDSVRYDIVATISVSD